MNDVIVYDGDVLGVPRIEKWDTVFTEGISTGFRFIDTFAAQVACEIENAARCGIGCEVRVKGVKVPSEINIEIKPHVNRWITSGNKKIDIRDRSLRCGWKLMADQNFDIFSMCT